MNLDISLEEALLGFTKTFKHLDGHDVIVKSQGSEIIQPFSWKILKDEGMPIRHLGEFGDLHVKMQVVFPKKLSKKQI
jgi:DnaJ-class molecular chaperone